MKNKKLLLGGIFGIFLVSIVGTYAFYTATAKNNTAINVTAANANLELTVTKSAGGTTLVPQLTQYLQSALTGTGGTSCIDANGNTVCQVYTITIKNTGTATAVLSGTLQLTAASMPNLKWEVLSGVKTRNGTPTTYSKTDTTLVSTLTLAKNATQTYYVAVWIAETGSTQNDSGSFNGTISFTYASGEGVTSSFVPEKSAAEKIMDLATPYASATATSGIYAVEHAATSQMAANTDYRYYGPSPDNYAIFNEEPWRVIGVFKTNDNNYHVKLIKEEELSSTYAFDSSNNDYETSTLKTYLNGDYYNSITDKSLIDSVTYYTAGHSTSSVLTEAFYGYERGTSVAVLGKTNVTTYIGLMYPSDYGYAAGKTCVDGTNLGSYKTSCAANDWLKLGSYEWLISPYSSFSYYAWFVNSGGNVDYDFDVVSAYAVRPVLYLKSTVKIKSGDGKEGSPFVFE